MKAFARKHLMVIAGAALLAVVLAGAIVQAPRAQSQLVPSGIGNNPTAILFPGGYWNISGISPTLVTASTNTNIAYPAGTCTQGTISAVVNPQVLSDTGYGVSGFGFTSASNTLTASFLILAGNQTSAYAYDAWCH